MKGSMMNYWRKPSSNSGTMNNLGYVNGVVTDYAPSAVNL
jgi:hypothetical protein